MNVKKLIATNLEPKLGAVYTPIEVATSVCDLVLKSFADRRHSSLKILEPSVGDGLFIKALDSFGVEYKLTAVDLNPNVIQQLKAEVKGLERQFIHANYIDYANENKTIKYDLIIGNPPFIKKHDYTEQFKLSLDELCLSVNYDRKELKNAWAAFVVAAESSLEENGILSFIVPYELMNVAYGQKLQQSIFALFSRVDIYIPDEKAFKEIDQDAVLFVAKKQCNNEKGLFVHRVNSLSDLQSRSVGRIDVSKKKTCQLI
jgi:adenine-specific DNA-methyltransferase